jgi:electron transport complex protein RnfG
MNVYKDVMRPTLILVAILLVVSTALVFTYKLTRQEIDEKAVLKEKIMMAKELLPEADDFDVAGEVLVAKNGKGKVIQSSSKGYSSDVVLMFGVDMNNNLKGLKIISQQETPGLGTEIETEDFINRFIGKKAPFAVKKVENATKIDALTGATISSKAVCNAINKGVEGASK